MLTMPRIEILAPRRIRLLEPYTYVWEVEGFPRQRLIVPAGFICDGASVPKALHWYLGWDEMLPAAIPHDYLYAYSGEIPVGSHHYLDEVWEWLPANHRWTRDEADRLFGRLLSYCPIPPRKRGVAYRAVRIGGGAAWRKRTWHPSDPPLLTVS
jgi:hypothetical protein